MTRDDVIEVFEAWRRRQSSPERCRLFEERARLIRNRLKRGYSADDLVVLIAYAYESDASEARFWRGENDSRATYLGLDNLLRIGKLADRVERAREWHEDKSDIEADVRPGHLSEYRHRGI
jgi:hypothetical protein